MCIYCDLNPNPTNVRNMGIENNSKSGSRYISVGESVAETQAMNETEIHWNLI